MLHAKTCINACNLHIFYEVFTIINMHIPTALVVMQEDEKSIIYPKRFPQRFYIPYLESIFTDHGFLTLKHFFLCASALDKCYTVSIIIPVEIYFLLCLLVFCYRITTSTGQFNCIELSLIGWLQMTTCHTMTASSLYDYTTLDDCIHPI